MADESLDPVDRAIICATQAGLPLCPQPYHAVAAALELDPDEVMRRLRLMLDRGVIRRIGVVPNHYRLGFRANGMTVWDVSDEEVDRLGLQVGALESVSHCYHRPRQGPEWPFNLFAMVHGRTRGDVEREAGRIGALLGNHARSHDILYSTRILKKSGLRIAG